jgi:hypothetical protein
MSQATFYKWRSKYGDANVNIVKRLKELEVKFPITFYNNDRLINQSKNGACAVSDEENCSPCWDKNICDTR